jgi:hypothetical protein
MKQLLILVLLFNASCATALTCKETHVVTNIYACAKTSCLVRLDDKRTVWSEKQYITVNGPVCADRLNDTR